MPVRLHMFVLENADGVRESVGVDENTFADAEARIRRERPDAKVLHALDNAMNLRVNGLGDRGEEIARNMASKHRR